MNRRRLYSGIQSPDGSVRALQNDLRDRRARAFFSGIDFEDFEGHRIAGMHFNIGKADPLPAAAIREGQIPERFVVVVKAVGKEM